MNSREIVQEIAIDAPRQRVFRALTDARELERWWTTRARSEPESGGAFRYAWTFPNAPERDHVQEGEYSTVEASERIAYPWKAGTVPTRVDFTLKDSGGGTTVRLSHSGWLDGMDGAYEAHAQGWGFFLGNLKSFLEAGLDRRAEAMGMKVEG